ncbi:MAG: hypothetical protein ACAF41_33835 (plasmid) [Leptolyngbya sp. BL-A-14]
MSSQFAPQTTLPLADHEQAIAIAVSLLKQQNPQTVQTLKDLLTFIPNPEHVNDVLTAAVLRLVYTCSKTALWLFRHPDVLAPGIQARDIIAQALTRQALAWGYSYEDFHFTADYALEVTEATRQALLSSQPHPDEQSAFDLIRVLLAIAVIAPDG